MAESIAGLPEWVATQAKVLLLLVVNILQPATRETIQKHISGEASLLQLQEVLDELCATGKVTEEDGHYRLTVSGLNSIIPGRGQTMRDIHRMEHLVRWSKQRGEDS